MLAKGEIPCRLTTDSIQCFRIDSMLARGEIPCRNELRIPYRLTTDSIQCFRIDAVNLWEAIGKEKSIDEQGRVDFLDTPSVFLWGICK